MMQAMMQQRQLNQNADQVFINAKQQTNQLKASLLDMAMSDTLARDQMAEGARQFDENLDLRAEQLEEQERASRERERLGRNQLALARDQYNRDIFEGNRDVAFGVLKEMDDTLSEISQAEQQIYAYQRKAQQGLTLTGAEKRDMASAQRTLRQLTQNAAVTLKGYEDAGKLDPQITAGIRNTLTGYADSALMNYELKEGEGLLTRPQEIPSQQASAGSLIDQLGMNLYDNITRAFSGPDELPPSVSRISEVGRELEAQPGAEWTSDHDAKVTWGLRSFLKSGAGRFLGKLGLSGENLEANQIKMAQQVEEKFEQAVYNKMLINTRGMDGTERSLYMSNPINVANTRKELEPVEMQNARAALNTATDLARVAKDLGQAEWMKELSTDGVPNQVQAMGLSQNPAVWMGRIKRQFENGEIAFLNPVDKKNFEALIETLGGWGVARDPSQQQEQ